eukprot:m.1037392 g.1037392  ORF g.1037392 m.1037392 type:complete len:427 (+) comp24143_c0_seq9:2498-3778(+)
MSVSGATVVAARQMRFCISSILSTGAQSRASTCQRQCNSLNRFVGFRTGQNSQFRTLTRGATEAAGARNDNHDSLIQDSVQNYYGKILETSKDLKTNACTTSDRPNNIVIDALRKVPSEVKEKYYGCGSPVPLGIEGLDVLDLGSGSGQDCYIAAALVGNEGSVTGIDMTDEQLDVARRHAESYTKNTLNYDHNNMVFHKGYIEKIADAGVAPESVDLVISNCVINLSPDKPAVIKGVHDALRLGGELYFSDVYADRRIPEEVRQHEVLWGECLAGALYIEDFKRICHSVGFTDPRELARSPIEVTDPELQAILGPIKFYSITYRCFKLAEMETLCEDYGQVAYYKGTITGHQHNYALDDHHVFETGRPMLVCGNTAAMVGDSWLRPHFNVVGDRSHHYGLFACGPEPATPSPASQNSAPTGGGCC